MLTPASNYELFDSKQVFEDRAKNGMTDGHMWLSVAVRTQQSSFTRVQRLTCCLSWLSMTMLASAMWYI